MPRSMENIALSLQLCKRSNDYSIPPLIQTLKEIKQEFSQQVFLNALEEGEIVGSVRAYLENGTVNIGRLMVSKQGIGTKV